MTIGPKQSSLFRDIYHLNVSLISEIGQKFENKRKNWPRLAKKEINLKIFELLSTRPLCLELLLSLFANNRAGILVQKARAISEVN